MFDRTRHLAQTRLVDPDTEWTRRRLQVLLGVAVVVVLGLVAGGVWSVVSMLTGTGASGDAGSEADLSAQDRLANEQLPEAPLEAAQPG
ncbi:MAG TPA: hypothetical protein DEQ43_26615, partial [Nocardioides bacterium]|nr:hypothetical protein [Nocardioides sp.]